LSLCQSFEAILKATRFPLSKRLSERINGKESTREHLHAVVLFVVSLKDEFGRGVAEEVHGARFKEMSPVMEMHFEPIARKILAGRRGKLALVHSAE
jgi:hypothetical protein